MYWDVLRCDGCVIYSSPTPPEGLSHWSDISSYLPDTSKKAEKKDESPRLSFLPPAVDLSAYLFPRIRSPNPLTVRLLKNNQHTGRRYPIDPIAVVTCQIQRRPRWRKSSSLVSGPWLLLCDCGWFWVEILGRGLNLGIAFATPCSTKTWILKKGDLFFYNFP